MDRETGEVAARVEKLCGVIHELKVDAEVAEKEPRFCLECGTKMQVALPLGFHFCPRRCLLGG